MSVPDSFREAITGELARIKRERFRGGYQASDAEAFGLMMAWFFDWDGYDIADAGAYALEDANYHDEAPKVRELLTERLDQIAKQLAT
jgi:hypothetical protein